MVESKKDEKMSYLFTAEKAGMKGLDRNQINKIIFESTKNSRMSKKNQEDLDKMKQDAEKTIQSLNQFHKNTILYNQIKNLADSRITKIQGERRLDKIWVHVDMDMFFAAVEIRDDPSLANIPMAVGSNQMISTSNYVARKFGVRSAMPGFLALKLCPSLKIIPGDYHKYSAESKKIMAIVEQYDPNYEQMGCDEAYIDLTEYCKEKNATTETDICGIVFELKNKIYETTKLTCSCGIGCNKSLAKICSDYNKPNGIYYLQFNEEKIKDFVKDLNIRKIPFIGQKTEQRLNLLGIFKCSDLLERYIDLFYLYDDARFDFFISAALGIGSYEHHEVQEDAKSISRGESFKMTGDLTVIKEKFIHLSKKIFNDMQKENVKCKTLSIEVIDITERKSMRCQTREKEYDNEEDIINIGWDILLNLVEKGEKIRMIRVKVSSLSKTNKTNDENSIVKWINNLKEDNQQKINEESSNNNNTNSNIPIDGKPIHIIPKIKEKINSTNIIRKSTTVQTLDIYKLLQKMKDSYIPDIPQKENKIIDIINPIKNKKKISSKRKTPNRRIKAIKNNNYFTLDSFLNRTI